MKYVRFLLVPLLFVSLAFMNVGGCNSNGDGGNVQPTNPPPTDAPPTNPPPTDPPPTDPPPTDPPPTDPPPPGACQMPALDTNFSDEGYFFFDNFTGFTIGVTSDGQDVVIVIIDSLGTSIGAIAFPLDAFACIIDVGIIGDLAFNASGICGRSDDATLFLIADFFIEGVEFVDLTIGECFAVEDLGTAALSQKGFEASKLETLAKRLHEEMTETRELETEPFSIENFTNTLKQFK